ncbi:MAG TPA: sulfite exporter TauE/SafE family protein [Candidatus Acidoferrales bacterium]|nr:sulfite exporter TauE/SafE family protein [Candidatus Acidoferrales bacterium]
MTTFTFVLLVLAGSFIAGLLGALTGLGGGVVIVPLLVVAFHVNIKYAIGASLVSVIATSSGAAAAYVREGFSNIRIGMFLEIATTIGAIFGAFLAARLATGVIAIVFGSVLVISSAVSARRWHEEKFTGRPDRWATLLKLNSSYPTPHGAESYQVCQVPAGFGMMFGAGALSGLLGIGSGAFKVLAMDQVMRIPFKVSTTTSNFMIGVTAAASAGIYLRRGFVAPGLVMPVVLGVLTGSVIGTRVLVRAHTTVLRIIFALVIAALGIEMIYGGVTGKF